LRSKNSYVLLVTLFYNVLLIFDNLLDIRFIYHNKFSLIAKDTISEQMLREAFFNNDITIFGCLMYTHYYYLFIVAGWILTSAMIYGIILSLNYNKV
jgi:NADH:ubiquinone oxidoreductase subunit 6 (subunit J)